MQEVPPSSGEQENKSLAPAPESNDSENQRQVGLEAWKGVRNFLFHTLNIQEGTDIPETTAGIKRDIVFQGPRVWILICSIFIASIGLNTNSGAVIIGAMLISPLMGPILGIGLAVGTNDFELLTRAVKNFAVMVVVSLATATIYFSITPLTEIQDELLSRTRPTMLDVLVALFGGMAGIIAGSRTEKSNVIPGVAIATALMPPLCTAGYGLAMANWSFFFGAFYLFLLNSVIISLSTWTVVRYLHFPLVEYVSAKKQRQYKMGIYGFAGLVIIPSAFLFVEVVRESYFHTRAEQYISQEFVYPGCEVVRSNVVYTDSTNIIEVFLIGEHIPLGEETQLKSKMVNYGLEDTQLKLYQSKDAAAEIEKYSGQVSEQVRAGIIEDLYRKNQEQLMGKDSIIANKDLQIRLLEDEIIRYRGDSIPFYQVQRELKVAYPELLRFGFSRAIETNLEGNTDTIPTVMVSWSSRTTRRSRAEQEAKLREWMEVRLNLDTLRVIGY